MAQLVVYYSLSGTTKAIAEEFAQKNGFDIRAAIPQKRIGALKAFFLVPRGMKGGGVPLRNIDVNFSDYETIHIFAPIWASQPAAPINTVLNWLPQGTKISLNFVSASGKSNKMFKLRDDLQVIAVNDILKPSERNNSK